MVLSKGKKILFLGLFSFFVIGVGITPLWLPPYIFDYSHINWNGADLAHDVMGDHTYFNNFQNFTTPTDLDAYDIRALPYEQQLVLTTLQGLVNKNNTSLYFIYRDSDAFWLARLREYYGVNYTITSSFTYWDIVIKYNTSIKGVIIYDENLLDTVNVATFLAGVNESVVIHPTMLSNFTSTLGVSPIYDFRGNFNSRVALYSWAFETLWPLANHKMIASRPYDKVYFRDYIVACKIFTFWLEVGPFGALEEVQLFRRIIAETPANIPVWGWFTDPGGAVGEYEAVKAISHSGKYSFCAAIPDLTVLSAFKDPLLNQKTVLFNVTDYPLENKIYLACTVSDGDNVDYVTNYLLNNIWQSPDRGAVPLGLTLEPLMARICPVGLRFYYENATNNEYFLAGPSGAGYTYPDMNPSFRKYLNTTKYAMDQSDMEQVWLLNGYEGYMPIYSSEVLNAYTSSNCNFTGIYLDYHDFQAEPNFLLNGVPVFHSMWVERENEIIGKLNSISNNKPNCPVFVFIGYNSWNFDFSSLKAVFDALPNDTFTFLRPDQFSELFKRYQEEFRAETWMNETVGLIIVIICFVIITVVLAAFWLFLKNRPEKEQNPSETLFFRTILKFFYVVLDVTLLLVVNFCFYSTILSVIYLLYLIISLFFGIQLRSLIEKKIGVRETIYLAIGLASCGFLLFALSPQFIIILGFPLGILLSRQVQSNHLLFDSSPLGKRSFLYSFLIAAVVILLVPFQYYPQLVWIISILFIIISIMILISFKDSHLRFFENFSSDIRHWYLKGVLFGFLLILLLNPFFAPERFFFHIFWGLESFPTKLTIAFAVAALYLSVILCFELLRWKDISLSKTKAIILMSAGLLCYLIMPLLLQSVFCFIFSIFLYILGVIAIADTFILSSLPLPKLHVPTINTPLKAKDPRHFLSQTFFWFIIGLFLIFIPPTVIVVDSQEAFSFLGLTGIDQLSWSSTLWALFYIPPTYMFLVAPITIFVLIFGVIKTISNLLYV
ncbi:MAG: hypothetical protein HWN66_03060 [Candidatus Helarchaeota archaeon]|nr:hypothetical protein [Candidatus Helarchaeota archaeon]